MSKTSKYFIGALSALLFFPHIVSAAIDNGVISGPLYAWSSGAGWVNWNPAQGEVRVLDNRLTGYIWSQTQGWINLSPSQGGVTNTNGVLGGHAWSVNAGWIAMSGITIDSAGNFTGVTTESNPVIGRMSFTCTTCGGATTDWKTPAVRAAAAAAASGGTSGGGSAYTPRATAAVTKPLALPFARLATFAYPENPLHMDLLAQAVARREGEEVRNLQSFLNKNHYYVAYGEAGGLGKETTRFGAKTRAALARMQKDYGIEGESGEFGPKTRALIEELSSKPTAVQQELKKKRTCALINNSLVSGGESDSIGVMQGFLNILLEPPRAVAEIGVFGPMTRMLVTQFQTIFAPVFTVIEGKAEDGTWGRKSALVASIIMGCEIK